MGSITTIIANNLGIKFWNHVFEIDECIFVLCVGLRSLKVFACQIHAWYCWESLGHVGFCQGGFCI